MSFVRIFTDIDGKTKFEEFSIPFVFEEGLLVGTFKGKTNWVEFRQQPPGFIQDWHTAPRRQYVITLTGEAELEAGSGEKRTFGPGDVLLADDLTGGGHVTKVISDVVRLSIAVPIEKG
jgi:quercetin dioxygenase-like cupin family protein